MFLSHHCLPPVLVITVVALSRKEMGLGKWYHLQAAKKAGRNALIGSELLSQSDALVPRVRQTSQTPALGRTSHAAWRRV